MSIFDQRWRKDVSPVLEEQFGETIEATYYDGGGNEQGTYTVLLSPEEMVEDDEDRGRRTKYQRTATITHAETIAFAEPALYTTGRLDVVEGGETKSYSIGGVLSRSRSAITLILRRTGGQRSNAG